LSLLDPVDARIAEQAAIVAAGWAAGGYRVLALADRDLPSRSDPASGANAIESGLRLVGVVAMADPARPEVTAAVAACRTAGITPVMITGDDPRTARAIAGRVRPTVPAGLKSSPARIWPGSMTGPCMIR
jgi:Ca2+-transporting ATPase